eukprot:CAMPEP_0184706170 /NCGR_PEP_ID=MMETSP0313-20130426/36620_1 /TAXON_ID=2792 /ORGANISM="Porphyridium aerugineum, Strain SAG 1380-2" /LENGTH=785 /DNA_ID=CAMNT_0027167717 /DNA_START=2308 /DNA_END=4662 /DNA_ORIENTATION=+
MAYEEGSTAIAEPASETRNRSGQSGTVEGIAPTTTAEQGEDLTLHGSAINLELLGIQHDPARDHEVGASDSSKSPTADDNISADDDYKLKRPPTFDEAPPPKKPTFWSVYKEEGLWKATVWRSKEFFWNNWGTLLFMFLCGLFLMFLGIFAFDPMGWQGWMSLAITFLMFGFLVNGQIAVQIVVLVAASSMMIFQIIPPNRALVGFSGWQGWMSLAITFLMFGFLVNGQIAVQIVVLVAASAMLIFQIIPPNKALVGFSNTGVAGVAALYAFSEGIERTSLMRPIFRWFMGNPKKLWIALVRLLFPVAAFSAVFHNTPIVAMLIPICVTWAKQNSLGVGKILMPMNNATVLGGVISILGTSTNLIVSTLATDNGLTDLDGNLLTFPIFKQAPAAVPTAVAGILYCIVAAHFLLKDRVGGLVDDISKNPRQYTVALKVEKRCPIVGQTVQGAGLRNLQGLFLIEIMRDDGTCLPAPSHDVVIMTGDIMLFAGIVETVKELYHIPGLVPATTQSSKLDVDRHRRKLVEVVISPSSDMIGYSIRETNFRSRYGAAIIAVHRHGEHIKEKIGDIVVRVGDVFLLETDEHFIEHFSKHYTFALVSVVDGSTPNREDLLHMIIAGVTTVAFIVVTAGDWLDVLTMALICTFFMAFTGCMTMAQAGAAVSIPILLTIACSFTIGGALERSGAALEMTNFIVDIFDFAPIGLIFGIYLGTMILSAILTNNAAVAVMFPIVADPQTGIIYQMGVNPYAGLYAMMFAGSLDFSTPIGYQTNLMVHYPGHYTFMDW